MLNSGSAALAAGFPRFNLRQEWGERQHGLGWEKEQRKGLNGGRGRRESKPPSLLLFPEVVSPSWRDVSDDATPPSEWTNKQRGAWNYEWTATDVTGRRLKGQQRRRGCPGIPRGAQPGPGSTGTGSCAGIHPRRGRYGQRQPPGAHQTSTARAPPPATPKGHKEHLKSVIFFLKKDLRCCTYTHYLHYKNPRETFAVLAMLCSFPLLLK